jgi:hypothetical protein
MTTTPEHRAAREGGEMSEDKRSKITKAIAAMLFPLLVGLFGGHLLIQIIDRFNSNETAWSFYSETADFTCIVARSRGQEVMWCTPGDQRKEEAK